MTHDVDAFVYSLVDFGSMSTTIRVSQRTRDRFAKLADATGRPMTQLVDEAVDALERRVFFDQLSVGYDALRDDANAWAEVEVERRAESDALRDRSP
jgi:predicted DNA-binding protein